MAALKEVFVAMGLRDARTFIASGNVVFDARDRDLHELETTIEGSLHDRLGYPVDTFIRTVEEVRALAHGHLFPKHESGPEDRIHVIFLKDEPGQGLGARLLEVVPEGDAVAIRGRDVLWLRRGKLSDVKLRGSDPVQAVTRIPSTMRNLNTLQRLSTTVFEAT